MKKIRAMLRARWEKGYITRYERAVWPLLYLFIYMRWFNFLEDAHRSHFVVMHAGLDDLIPFFEVFIIPYYAWFFYVFFTLAFLFFLRHAEDYYKALVFMGIGMTFFLVFSTFVPTLQPLRPAVMPRDNVFTRMVAHLWQSDTPTNVFPSMHVYNSIACMIALNRTKALEKHRAVRVFSVILSITVILATMFVKQHSVLDVAGAFVLAVIAYRIVYQSDLVVNLLHIHEREFAIPARWSLF